MVNTERILAEFQTLVSMDSESYEEREIADYLKKKLQDLGLEVFEDTAGVKLAKQRERAGKSAKKSAGNIYGYLRGTKEGEPILFSSHMKRIIYAKTNMIGIIIYLFVSIKSFLSDYLPPDLLL